MSDTPCIPDDLSACQAIIVEQARTITELHEKVQEQELEINGLLQRAYRNRSERYREAPNQLMKQVATGRKNWLFVGSVEAGERAADFFALVSSALRNDLDVCAYVKHVLDRLLAGEKDYAALRPDHWAAQHPEHIRVYRQDERRYRADARQSRRAARRRPSKPT
ncbi:MAG: hypothetical protein RBS80_20795 [Thermoguttaceae bacterium]|jgi:hypothetical protein|nr:hypothetical protein [Thermoguttaceae bacterium]